MHALTLVCGEGSRVHVNVSLFWTTFKSEKKKTCSSSVLDNRQTWFIWGKKVVLQFLVLTWKVMDIGSSLSPQNSWRSELCKIYTPQAKKEHAPTVTPILLKQTVRTIMCNLADSMFCLPFIYSNPVQHFTLSNEAETRKEKLCLSKHFCLGCYFFLSFISK